MIVPADTHIVHAQNQNILPKRFCVGKLSTFFAIGNQRVFRKQKFRTRQRYNITHLKACLKSFNSFWNIKICNW